MRKGILSVIGIYMLCLMSACSSNDKNMPEIPAGILSPEKYTKLLVDFSLAESASNMNIKNIPIYKLDTVYAFDPLKENGVRPSQYDSSVAFYSKHTKLNKKIYEDVLTALSELQTARSINQKTDSAR